MLPLVPLGMVPCLYSFLDCVYNCFVRCLLRLIPVHRPIVSDLPKVPITVQASCDSAWSLACTVFWVVLLLPPLPLGMEPCLYSFLGCDNNPLY